MPHRYIGSGPYCYANSLAMIINARRGTESLPIEPSLVEVLTGSPFGMSVQADDVPFFNPPGWNPEIGLDAAMAGLGWTCRRISGGDDQAALDRLRTASGADAALVGPMEMGLLHHQPEAAGPIGADHFVVVLGVDADKVLFHDPHGYPFATLPIDQFLAAWRAESIGYATAPFTMRVGFREEFQVSQQVALEHGLTVARHWLAQEPHLDPTPETPNAGTPNAGTPNAGTPNAVGGRRAAERLAELVEIGLDDSIRGHLVHFAVRVGARRLADAAYWLERIGYHRASALADRQARLVGGIQYQLVSEDRAAAGASLRALAGTYAPLRTAIDKRS